MTPATRKIWTWPVVLGLASLAGLIFALVGDGVWDWLSWLALGAPLIVIGACLRRA